MSPESVPAPATSGEHAAAIVSRKREHLDLAASEASRSPRSAGWEDVRLVPAALPEVSPDDVDLTARLLGHELRAPLVIASMTGGHPDASAINALLGEAAERFGLAVGVGSQRAALRDPRLAPTYASVRDRAPSAVVLANVGACQLVAQPDAPALTPPKLEEAVAMVAAQGLSVHLNVLEEAIQPEGDRRFDGMLDAIARLSGELSVPLIAKETGAGLDRESALVLAQARVAALDVGGAGGTSFARIETARAQRAGELRRAAVGATFADWGVPTASAILETRGAGVPVIATGGVRNGLDAAKALALGASCVSVGRLALHAAQQGRSALFDALETLIAELRLALVLCGARDVRALRRRPPVLTGATREWAQQRRL